MTLQEVNERVLCSFPRVEIDHDNEYKVVKPLFILPFKVGIGSPLREILQACSRTFGPMEVWLPGADCVV